jgi:hypothetical protein
MENCDFSMTHDNFTMQSWGSAMTLENLSVEHVFFTMDHASSERFNRRQVTQAAEYWQALQDIDGFWVLESSADEFYWLFRCIWVDYNDLTATSL